MYINFENIKDIYHNGKKVSKVMHMDKCEYENNEISHPIYTSNNEILLLANGEPLETRGS